MGIFTPTEAGAMACFGAIMLGLMTRGLSFRGFVTSGLEAIRINGIMLFIFVFAFAFSRFLAMSNLPYDFGEWFVGLGLSPYVIISAILLIYMGLGCVMNAIPAVIITLPIFYPIAMAAGFDPLWFGVLITLMVALGQITPPIGMNVFAMSAIAKDVPVYSIFRGVLPFWIAFMVVAVILILFPQISLFLPSLM